eukprot:gene6167-7681_t
MKEYEKGTTALHIAASRGHKQSIELLVVRGADVNAQDNRGVTPLHSLVQNRYDILALWIIRQGANIHVPDNNGHSPYDLAQGWFQKEMVAASEGKPSLSEEDIPTTSSINNSNNNNNSQMYETISRSAGIKDMVNAVVTSEVLKIYFRNDSYKSVKVSSTDNAREICKRMSEKFNMPSYDKCFDIVEVIKGEVRYLGPNDLVLQSKSKWPIIVGVTGNETSLHCHFSIVIRKTAPTEAHDLFTKVV